ncbi:amino acid racemase [Brevibacillus humidisoli]|uniref:aspartate/glutamate racemase family protein n=1 Tax=Brevibacillus humidisoli TaxID=2895522 RepID=UPI001E421E97|nr:amino acid racemase [Brevibacillus humidisoli]UFJ39017.1 amino acid racemase [Brevibacillus humidisoli]
MSKVIGVLGGMGPMATLDMVKKIIENTPVQQEHDHLRMLIYNNPKIPSRIDALKPGHESPVPEMIRTAITLEQAGADFIVIPCHSAHYWLDEISASISIPIYSIIECTVEHIITQTKGRSEQILLLATETTIRSGLYQRAFEKTSVQLIIPDIDQQTLVNQIIHEVKTKHRPTLSTIESVREMIAGYQITNVLGGCTEIPLLFPPFEKEFTFIDPTLLLAKKTVRLALQK